MLKVTVGYPTREEELKIIDRMTGSSTASVQKVTTTEQLLKARDVVKQVYLDDRIKQYIVNLVFATREPGSVGAGALKDLIEYGASPRASIYLVQAARAHAFLKRRGYVIPEDIKSIGLDVLRHRVVPTYEAEAEDLSSEDIVKRLFELVEVP
jgi:MoxR-like ATPase